MWEMTVCPSTAPLLSQYPQAGLEAVLIRPPHPIRAPAFTSFIKPFCHCCACVRACFLFHCSIFVPKCLFIDLSSLFPPSSVIMRSCVPLLLSLQHTEGLAQDSYMLTFFFAASALLKSSSPGFEFLQKNPIFLFSIVVELWTQMSIFLDRTVVTGDVCYPFLK